MRIDEGLMIFVHIILFLLTIGSTLFFGGPQYSVAIMTILLSHEMGHYFMTRRYGIPSTLPFFIPFPMEPFGTFGAIIRMKGIIINKKALFDIGVAGPICGFVVALPFTIAGILMSSVQVPIGLGRDLGEPLLFVLLQKVLIGDIPEGLELVLHPFAYAGWVGLFVTALNLLPFGQLDGGHVIYSIFGERSRWVFRICIVALAILAVFYSPTWLTLVVLLLLFGMRHPQPYDVETRLNTGRKSVACLVLIIFILSFVPAPFPEMKTSNLIDMFKK